MTTPPEPPKDSPPKDDAGGPLTERVGKIEAEQQRQGGILERIEGMLAGGPDSDAPPVTGTDPAAGPADMAEQMRQAVRDVQAEEDAAAGRAARLGKKPEPETTPREVMIRGKDRLQRALFGGDPK